MSYPLRSAVNQHSQFQSVTGLPYDNEQVSMPFFPKKKARKQYDVSTKLKYLKLAELFGVSYVVSTKGVSRSLLSRWKKQVPQYLLAKSERKMSKKRIRSASHSTVFTEDQEKQIFDKIQKLRDAMIPVSGPMVKIFALQVAREHQIQDFDASNGFVTRFRKRWNLTLRRGTKRSPKLDSDIIRKLEEMQRDVYNKCIHHDIDYICNIDETPIVYDLMYDHTLANCGDAEVLIAKVKSAKKRITLGILLPVPWKPDLPQVFKCKPMMIFKGMTPRCLNDVSRVHKEDTTILIRHQKKAWNDANLYVDFLQHSLPDEIVGPNRRQDYKILVVHDNVEFHLATQVSDLCKKDYGIEPHCLPPNATAICQPLDVAINRPFKDGMRKKLMENLVDSYTGGEIFISKNDLISWGKDVWYNSISNDTIKKSFLTCALGVSPVDKEQPIYWKRLRSLQSQLQDETLPSIASLTQNLFNGNVWDDSNHPSVFLYTPERFNVPVNYI